MVRRILVAPALVLSLVALALALPAHAQVPSAATYTVVLARETDEALEVGEVQRLLVQVERQCGPHHVYLDSETVHITMYWSEPSLVVAGPSQVILPEQVCVGQPSVFAEQAYDASLTQPANATMATVGSRIDATGNTFAWGGQAETTAILPLAAQNETEEEPLAAVQRSNDSPVPVAFALVPVFLAALLRRRLA